jgi:hypothetical protein
MKKAKALKTQAVFTWQQHYGGMHLIIMPGVGRGEGGGCKRKSHMK